jgi:hypothetical protein
MRLGIKNTRESRMVKCTLTGNPLQSRDVVILEGRPYSKNALQERAQAGTLVKVSFFGNKRKIPRTALDAGPDKLVRDQLLSHLLQILEEAPDCTLEEALRRCKTPLLKAEGNKEWVMTPSGFSYPLKELEEYAAFLKMNQKEMQDPMTNASIPREDCYWHPLSVGGYLARFTQETPLNDVLRQLTFGRPVSIASGLYSRSFQGEYGILQETLRLSGVYTRKEIRIKSGTLFFLMAYSIADIIFGRSTSKSFYGGFPVFILAAAILLEIKQLISSCSTPMNFLFSTLFLCREKEMITLPSKIIAGFSIVLSMAMILLDSENDILLSTALGVSYVGPVIAMRQVSASIFCLQRLLSTHEKARHSKAYNISKSVAKLAASIIAVFELHLQMQDNGFYALTNGQSQYMRMAIAIALMPFNIVQNQALVELCFTKINECCSPLIPMKNRLFHAIDFLASAILYACFFYDYFRNVRTDKDYSLYDFELACLLFFKVIMTPCFNCTSRQFSKYHALMPYHEYFGTTNDEKPRFEELEEELEAAAETNSIEGHELEERERDTRKLLGKEGDAHASFRPF